MAKKGEDLWFLQLDFDWMHDAKIARLRAKYGKAILVDAINTFILMAKCDGIADVNDPAHADWATQYIGKTGRSLRSTLDKLAEFGVIDPELWSKFGHVTNGRACSNAEKRRKKDESDRHRTEKAREVLKKKRERERSVTESVTDRVTDT